MPFDHHQTIHLWKGIETPPADAPCSPEGIGTQMPWLEQAQQLPPGMHRIQGLLACQHRPQICGRGGLGLGWGSCSLVSIGCGGETAPPTSHPIPSKETRASPPALLLSTGVSPYCPHASPGILWTRAACPTPCTRSEGRTGKRGAEYETRVFQCMSLGCAPHVGVLAFLWSAACHAQPAAPSLGYAHCL